MGISFTSKDIAMLTRYIGDCKSAGMPRDQIDRFLNAGYYPHHAQMLWHSACRATEEKGSPVRYVLGGGSRAGGKSFASICQVGLDDAQRYAGLKILFLRKVQKAAKESFRDLTRKALRNVECTAKQFQLDFANGSFMIFGGYRNPADIEKYIGIEYDLIIIEELTQLTYDVFNKIDGSCRSSRTDGWKPRLYLTTNPGGIGHSWVKEKFIMPQRCGNEDNTRFIPWNYEANPYIDKGYGEYLKGLGGELGKAWRDGNWDLNEGAAFAFDPRKHVISNLPEIDDSYMLLRGIDYGYAAPYCCLWAYYQPQIGRVIVFREDYKTGLTSKLQAERVAAMTPKEENDRLVATYCDPAMFGKKAQEIVTSDEEVYRNAGIRLTAGSNDRLAGKRKIDNMLLPRADGLPGILIHKSCKNLIDQMCNLIFDDVKIEDVNTRMPDHAYDALRYLMTRVRDPMGAFIDNELERRRNNFSVYKEMFG